METEKPSNQDEISSEFSKLDINSYDSNICIDPASFVINECITLTSAMRKNARWAQSGVAAILGNVASVDTFGRNSISSRFGIPSSIRSRSIQESPLMVRFTKLRSDLLKFRDIKKLNALDLTDPFLAVIESSSTTGPITSLALNTITKLFNYNIISTDLQGFQPCLQKITSSITQCRFEASDSAQDEVVLYRILKLIEIMISGPMGSYLNNTSVCAMIETSLSMSYQSRMSEILKRSAEMTMITLCQRMFTKLKHISITNDKFLSKKAKHKKHDKALISTNQQINNKQEKVSESINESNASNNNNNNTNDINNTNNNSQTPNNNQRNSTEKHSHNENKDKSSEFKHPYGLLSIHAFLRVLTSILDQNNSRYSDGMRLMALRIIDVAFEVAGSDIVRHSALRALVVDDLSKFLLQLIRSDSPQILQTSLRVISTILYTARSELKLQQEMFISYIISCVHVEIEVSGDPEIDPTLYQGVISAPKLFKVSSSSSFVSGSASSTHLRDLPGASSNGQSYSASNSIDLGSTSNNISASTSTAITSGRSPDAREALVESITGILRIPGFLSELYINFDCDIARNDLAEDVIEFLARNALPDSADWSTPNVPPLCLDALLAQISYISDRIAVPDIFPSTSSSLDLSKNSSEASNQKFLQQFPTAEEAHARAQRKHLIIECVEAFNRKPKEGIALAIKENILPENPDPKSIVDFLTSTSAINKKCLGEYIASSQNAPILEEFISRVNLSGKGIDEALRALLGSFRLPGEAQQIDRIMEAFAKRYQSQNPKVINNSDSAYVLSFSIIMLNTDQHSTQVKKRMSLENYKNNLRGQNNGVDFPVEFLTEIYENIRDNEIIMPEEHDTDISFDYQWRQFQSRLDDHSQHHHQKLIILPDELNIYDKGIFEIIWKPVLATLSYVFASATEDSVFQRIITGFDQVSRIAKHYNMPEVLDRIVFCLSKITGIASEDHMYRPELNSLIISQDGSSITVSEIAILFGRNFRAQLSMLVLFRIANSNYKLLSKSWIQVIRIWVTLFVNSLIGPTFVDPELQYDYLKLSPTKLPDPQNVIDRRYGNKDAGLFSTLSSYLSGYAADEPPEPTDEELECTLCSVDCVQSCNFLEMWKDMTHFEDESVLNNFIDAILVEISRLWKIHNIPQNKRKQSSNNLNAQEVVNPVPENIKEPNEATKLESQFHRYEVVLQSPSKRKKLTDSFITELHLNDPAITYLFDMAVTFYVANSSSASEDIGTNLINYLTAIVKEFTDVDISLIGRIIAYIFDILCNTRFEKSFIKETLKNIASINVIILQSHSYEYIDALLNFITHIDKNNTEFMYDKNLWIILKQVASTPQFGNSSLTSSSSSSTTEHINGALRLFDFLSNTVENESDLISIDNFLQFVDVFDEFATQGAIGVIWEQNQSNDVSSNGRMHNNSSHTLNEKQRSLSTPSIKSQQHKNNNHHHKHQHNQRNQRLNSNSNNEENNSGSSTIEENSSNKKNIKDGSNKSLSNNESLKKENNSNIRRFSSTAHSSHGIYSEAVQVAIYSIDNIYKLSTIIGKIVDKSPGNYSKSEIWKKLWFPLLSTLAGQSINPCGDIRAHALGYLRQILLSSSMIPIADGSDDSLTEEDFSSTFTKILFPLIHELLKPKVYESDPTGMDDTRSQAASLLSKIFLHYIVLLSDKWTSMVELWLHILDLMSRLLNSGQKGSLEEAVKESLKNALLVMITSNLLVEPENEDEFMSSNGFSSQTQSPPRFTTKGKNIGTLNAEEQKINMWYQTWGKVDSFLPGLKEELVPGSRNRIDEEKESTDNETNTKEDDLKTEGGLQELIMS